MPQTLSFEQLTNQLLEPSLYPHPVDVITTIETHSAIVFLTGPYAYKLKKPVHFEFLDFSTLEKRRDYTQLELTLNQRTAPEIYLDVLPLYLNPLSTPSPISFAATGTPPIAYLLKMKQFDPNAVLGRALQHAPLSTNAQQRLAYKIAHLHQHADQASTNTPYGTFETIMSAMTENFPPLLAYFSHTNAQNDLHSLQDWLNQQSQKLAPLLTQRKQKGHIKACHGDLHADNIALLLDDPILFDAIEFNEDFRWIDPLNDLAFLLADLTERGHRTLKNWLKNRYLQLTGDYQALELLDFYQVYRHLVRAKVSILRAQQIPPTHAHQKAELQHKAHQAILHAQQIAYSIKNPKLILMQGLSGSGKSTLAEQLSEKTGALVINSDIERKRLYGIQEHHRVSETEKSQLYSQEMNLKTYQTLETLAQSLLNKGETVIVDATFLRQSHRTPYQQLAKNLNIPYKIISLQPDEKTLEAQLTSRSQNNTNASDADIPIMLRQKPYFEPPSKDEPHLVYQHASQLNDLQKWMTLPIT